MSPTPIGRRARRVASLLLLLAIALSTACQSATNPRAESDAPSVYDLAIDLLARRNVMIERLREYREAGVYPRNRVLPEQANVFIDEDGHLCAVANLMWLDGQHDLVNATARDNNLVVLRDVHEGPLYDWMMSSGLTQAEIARIQEPYMPFEPEDPNFGQNEDQRLDNHFVQVEQELTQVDGWAILQAARAQREQIVASAE